MTLKHVLKHFSKTEVQEDEKLVIQRVKPEESQNHEILRFAQDDERFSLAPMREREELLCERSELSNSGEGYISCAEHTVTVFSPFTSHFSQLCTPHPSPLPQGAREQTSCAEHTVTVFSPFTSHFSQLCTPHPSPLPQGAREQTSCAEHTVKNLSSNRLTILTTLKHKLDCFAYARNDDLCAKHTEKNLFTYLSIHLFTSKKVAFTLAEVLITLAIIGVVAALTLPTLIQNHQKRVLKSQFLKEYSMLQQSFLKIKQEFGTDDMYKYCVLSSSELGYINKNECFAAVDKILKPVGSCVYNPRVLTYTKDKQAYVDIGGSKNPSIRLSDGSCVERTINSKTFGFTIDVNGDKKGPNALGHDIFVFWVQNGDFLKPVKMEKYLGQDDLDSMLADKGCTPDSAPTTCGAGAQQFGSPCSRKSSQMGNGLGCSWYALNDICPDDETKGYWDCLP